MCSLGILMGTTLDWISAPWSRQPRWTSGMMRPVASSQRQDRQRLDRLRRGGEDSCHRLGDAAAARDAAVAGAATAGAFMAASFAGLCGRIHGPRHRNGAFSTVYKGIVPDTGAMVAVKRCTTNARGGGGNASSGEQQAVVPHSARHFGRAITMPNLKPLVTTTARAVEYSEETMKALPLLIGTTGFRHVKLWTVRMLLSTLELARGWCTAGSMPILTSSLNLSLLIQFPCKEKSVLFVVICTA